MTTAFYDRDYRSHCPEPPTTPSAASPVVCCQIEVRVVFDRPVTVTGSPRLLLDTGAYALYDGTFEDGVEVSAGDIINGRLIGPFFFFSPGYHNPQSPPERFPTNIDCQEH